MFVYIDSSHGFLALLTSSYKRFCCDNHDGFYFFWSLQHVKKAALRGFGASSAEVLCEVGKCAFAATCLLFIFLGSIPWSWKMTSMLRMLFPLNIS
jgi:hypothetical protein